MVLGLDTCRQVGANNVRPQGDNLLSRACVWLCAIKTRPGCTQARQLLPQVWEARSKDARFKRLWDPHAVVALPWPAADQCGLTRLRALGMAWCRPLLIREAWQNIGPHTRGLQRM